MIGITNLNQASVLLVNGQQKNTHNASKLSTVYISQSGLDSYNAVVNDGVNIVDMWKNTKAGGFTVK